MLTKLLFDLMAFPTSQIDSIQFCNAGIAVMDCHCPTGRELEMILAIASRQIVGPSVGRQATHLIPGNHPAMWTVGC